jgi:4-aminobutyrate aminotransferase/(S)-3-amino-2-methylpropionate transaminase
VIGRADIMDAPDPGGLGGTFAGNPLACAAGLAVLDIFEEEGLLEKGRRLGARLRESLLSMQALYPNVGDVRGLGPMLAMELVESRESKAPAQALASRVVDAALEHGLILLKAGLYSNVIRLHAPLVIEDSQLERALIALAAAMQQVLPATGDR